MFCAAFPCVGAHSASARRVRLAIPGYNITQIAFFSAKDKVYFKEEGLDVDLAVKSAGAKDAPAPERFFSFVLNKQVANELQVGGWKPGT